MSEPSGGAPRALPAGVPEPRGRIVVFRALTEAELTKIVEIQLEGLRRRLGERRITIEISARRPAPTSPASATTPSSARARSSGRSSGRSRHRSRG